MLKFIFTYKTEIFLIIIEALYIFLYMQWVNKAYFSLKECQKLSQV